MGLDSLKVDLTVVLGKTRLPLHRLLRMGRGAVLALDATENDKVEILANGLPVARGEIIVRGAAIHVQVTELIRKPDIVRDAGATIGGAPKAAVAPAPEPAPAAG